ncbi:hypothetical protein ABIA32_004287 [Streptacidiphilus sp. MAP12-20]|uniref:hypothetical protein n=1 Tax=Streptacidiphilus sp. MAP12-20 TaxID=3156299 RepID=UPI003518612B
MTLPLTIDTDAYEAGFGWNGRQVVSLVSGLFLLLVGVVLALGAPTTTSRFFGVICVLFALFLLTIQSIIGFSRKTAIRIDEMGVLLGGSPLRYAATTAFVPWSDVVAVELWIQQVGLWRKIHYVGLHRVPGAPPLNGAQTNRAALAVAKSLTEKSAELIGASRATVGWKFDAREMLSTVQRLAPQVQIYVDPDFKL